MSVSLFLNPPISHCIFEMLFRRTQKVDFEQERDKEKGFLGYYLDSLLAGFKEVIGMPF